eukprot:6994-Pelagomonas_calceolata.AAC.1
MEPQRKSSRLYVGGLPMDIKEEEVEDLFYKFGDIRTLDLKIPGKPPAFAFLGKLGSLLAEMHAHHHYSLMDKFASYVQPPS